MKEVVEPSPDRVKPNCPVYGRCGGCHYQHLSYPRQLAIKSEQVAEVLRRLGGVPNPPVEPIVPSPVQFHYRNRITVHSKSGRVGFFGPRSRRIVEVSQCPIATERVNALLTALRESRPKMANIPCASRRNSEVFARSTMQSQTVSWRLSKRWRDPAVDYWWTLIAAPASSRNGWPLFLN